MNKLFTVNAWDEYLCWQATDKRMRKRIDALVKDIDLNGHEGIGKPEPLCHELQGYWSRRINSKHRLIYAIEDNQIKILKCRYHHEQ